MTLFHQVGKAEIPVCDINPGEPFGISALIAPHVLTSTARSTGESRAIRLGVDDLKSAFVRHAKLECLMVRCVAEAAMGRLNSTRVQLAAAYA
ncbi:MAG: hypothetical protein A2136_05010 [Chloroflexi bacterium RBG_16_54_11]|nr:MAG: hypothetical protein A2136_05010 [Chloroflexi bacterium RBG_16_54_11]